jgi:hypothetical protein
MRSSEIAGIFGVHMKYQEEQNTDKSNRYLEVPIRNTDVHISYQVFNALDWLVVVRTPGVLQPKHPFVRVDLDISWWDQSFNVRRPPQLVCQVLNVLQSEHFARVELHLAQYGVFALRRFVN